MRKPSATMNIKHISVQIKILAKTFKILIAAAKHSGFDGSRELAA